MPQVYYALKNNTVVQLTPSEVARTAGAAIMKTLAGPKTFDNMFQSFCAYFHAPGRGTWTGAAVTPDSGAILDAESNAKVGQCLALARALRLLAVTRMPYGLNLTETLVGDPGALTGGKYAGRYGNGFISNHPAAGVLGLMRNVWAAGPQLPPLHAWPPSTFGRTTRPCLSGDGFMTRHTGTFTTASRTWPCTT